MDAMVGHNMGQTLRNSSPKIISVIGITAASDALDSAGRSDPFGIADREVLGTPRSE